ncbi:uncharacterized protein ALTATR162_LOCUS4442 [Alternaria atra]|uniref:Uncharacterized protein n=1 Tax=Alternaria atra TaxID=119953 RepID=A0A8J2I4Z1_9PLEO|nr:uncharacterized protein ALTATR162_LOCUS4442 [Alternaria atra]CAG5156645.1 unnamed protein product [Alternaria atra]
MKLTLTVAALIGLFATSAVATREWVYNDHRRSLDLQEHFERTVTKHAHLCKRWDAARCLDDEDKPSPWEMEYLQRKTAKIEKQDAEHAVEKINALWNKWIVEEAERMSKGKKVDKSLE